MYYGPGSVDIIANGQPAAADAAAYAGEAYR